MTSLVVRSVTPCQHKRNISNELDEIACVHYKFLPLGLWWWRFGARAVLW